jgi:hypothetical protein
MDIPDIGKKSISIKSIEIPVRNFNDPTIPSYITPPVTVQVGLPIVDIPGCVETRETDDLREVDPRGNMVLCDGGIPSYNPINFEPNRIVPTAPAGVDTKQQEKKPEPPGQVDIPNPAPPATVKVDCPTAAQQSKEPVGTYVEGFRKKVTEYKLIGNECVQITEAVPLPQQIVAGLPSGGQVVQVGSIAVVATSSALLAKPLADILLKAVKPTIKKVMKKIAAIRKKPIPVLSSGERRAEQRQMNHAVRELRSVFPRKKKQKG